MADIGNATAVGKIEVTVNKATTASVWYNPRVVEVEQIMALVDHLARVHNPLKVIVFGSYAYGTPTEDSDVDLLILTRSRKSNHQQFVEVRKTIDVDFALELVVRRESDVLKRIEWNEFFLREVMENGIVLHAADDAGMGQKGRRRLRRRFASAASPV